MVRKHGWQLPAHTFQVVAITVYCLLVVAFFAFFAPFLGGNIWEYALVAGYSPVAALVFVLYVRCTAINPADPGIMTKFNSEPRNKNSISHGLSAQDLPQKFDEHSVGICSSVSSPSKSSVPAANSSKRASLEAGSTNMQVTSPTTKSSCWHPGKIFCGVFVHEDCCNQDGMDDLEGAGEDALFCTLCNAEVANSVWHYIFLDRNNSISILLFCIPIIMENASHEHG